MEGFLKLIVIFCGAVAMLGCSHEAAEGVGLPISILREHAVRSSTCGIGATNRVVTFTADMEYPSRYGIGRSEYERLMGFVNQLFNGGTNFTESVNEVSQAVFKGVCEASTNANFDVSSDLDLKIAGAITYSDERYFSYELNLSGLYVDNLRCTYDRQLGRIITIEDLVPSNRFDKLRGFMRDYIKLAMPIQSDEGMSNHPNDWPAIKETFTVDLMGITWIYSKDELDCGSWMEIRVGWDDLKEIVDDHSVIPTGRFAICDRRPNQADEQDWWDFPFERVESVETTPPIPPFIGTNYPYASVTLKIENPSQGGMSTKKFRALQRCLARAVSPHGDVECLTVTGAVRNEVIRFWREVVKETKDESSDGGFGIFVLETKIMYRGPEYVSFAIKNQNGCPCCAESTNVVWSWRTESPLKIWEVIKQSETKGLKQLMRKRVREDLEADYEDSPELVLPDYAKNWPYAFDNFSLDENGVTWFCDAGEVILGGKGSYGTHLTWEELSPYMVKGFVIPSSPDMSK